MFYFLTKKNIWVPLETTTHHFSIEAPVCQEKAYGTHTEVKPNSPPPPPLLFFLSTVKFSHPRLKSHFQGYNRTTHSFLSRSLSRFVNTQYFVSQLRKLYFMTKQVLHKEINKNKVFSAKHNSIFMHKLPIHHCHLLINASF